MRIRRSIRSLGKLLIPEVVKQRLRGRLHGYRAARVAIPHVLTTRDDGHVDLRIDGLAPLTVTRSLVDSFMYHLERNGESIEELHRFIAEARVGDGVLLDVGANQGVFSLAYSAARPRNIAIAFEPAPEPLGNLMRSARLSGLADRIEPVRTWISESSGSVTGVIDECGFFGENPRGDQTVPATSIDAFIAARGIRPAVLKIDVEGAELAVLQGARSTLDTHRPVVFLELHHDLLVQQGIDPRAAVSLLTDAGYSFTDCTGIALRPPQVFDAYGALLRVVALPE